LRRYNQFREPLLKIFLKVGSAFRHRPPPHQAHLEPSFLEFIEILGQASDNLKALPKEDQAAEEEERGRGGLR